MMRASARYHGRALVRRLLEANLADVPAIVEQIGLHRRWTDPVLWRGARTGRGGRPGQAAHRAGPPADRGQPARPGLRSIGPGDAGRLPDPARCPLPLPARDVGRLWDDAGSTGDDGRVLRGGRRLGRTTIRSTSLGSRSATTWPGSWPASRRSCWASGRTRCGPSGRAARPAGGDLPRRRGRRAAAFAGHLDTRRLRGRRHDGPGRPDQGCRPRQFAALFPVLARDSAPRSPS